MCEAIRQLEREGLLIAHPYRETVAAIHIDEVKDILIPIRHHLEWYVMQKYIGQMDASFLAKLQQIVDRMAACFTEKKLDQIVELDDLFHETIIDLAVERTVLMTWRSILNQTRLHFIKNARYYSNAQMVKDHQKLLDSMASKNLELISQELQYHMKGDEAFLFT